MTAADPPSQSAGGSRLYCCGYWNVAGSRKRSHAHYAALLPETLDMIRGARLHFITNDPAQADAVRALCAPRGISCETELVEITDLPGHALAGRLLESCRNMALDTFPEPPEHGSEKGMIHYWRDFRGSGAEAYRAVLAIWLSKVGLSARLAAEHAAAGGQVAWIDVSVARFNGLRENWDFHRADTPPDKLSHYASPMKFYGAPLPLNASFLCASAPVWDQVAALFAQAGERGAAMPYGHDEETLMADCIWRRPDLFHVLGRRAKQSLAFRLKRRLRQAFS